MTRWQKIVMMQRWQIGVTLFGWFVKLTAKEATPTMEQAYREVTDEILRFAERYKNLH